MEEAVKIVEPHRTLPQSGSVPDAAVPSTWDVVVIGAGPAGTLAARQSALAGLSTLIVDAKRFPREKVCGGYLNARALRVLQHNELLHILPRQPNSKVLTLNLAIGHKRACFPLPPGQVICRATFDAALLENARAAGAAVLTGVPAVVDTHFDDGLRRVALGEGQSRACVRARVVICADGLSRSSLRHLPQSDIAVALDSRVGIGAVVDNCGDDGGFPTGQITMVVSRHGYVGISRIDQRRLNIAAAIEPAILSSAAPGEIIADILARAEICVPTALGSVSWRGTPPLTIRPRRVALERLFIIGDAGGYVEPFTGEGMAAALESAAALSPLVVQAAREWVPSLATCWESLHRQIVQHRQHTCRQLVWILRRPWATWAALAMCRALPGIATRLIANTTRTSDHAHGR
jgi:flavin-dependent dehydrogenase